MAAGQLEVTSIDALSGHVFLLYFSDGTVAKVTAQQLAACFPQRKRVRY